MECSFRLLQPFRSLKCIPCQRKRLLDKHPETADSYLESMTLDDTHPYILTAFSANPADPSQPWTLSANDLVLVDGCKLSQMISFISAHQAED